MALQACVGAVLAVDKACLQLVLTRALFSCTSSTLDVGGTCSGHHTLQREGLLPTQQHCELPWLI